MGKAMLKSIFIALTAVATVFTFFSCQQSVNDDDNAAGSKNSTTYGSYEEDTVTEKPILFQDFSNKLDTKIWVASGSSSKVTVDEVLKKYPQYGSDLKDTHGKVYSISSVSGESSLTIKDLVIKSAAAITFDYKLDLIDSHYLEVYVDGSRMFQEKGGVGKIWKSKSINLSAGTHTIIFKVNKTNGYYGVGITNAAFLDNISVVSDSTALVGLYPKGTQETRAGGDNIQFSAKALRADRSERSGRTVTWSCTGGTISSEGVFTPGSTPGVYQVKATVDGKTSINKSVIVHDKTDYLAESVTVAGIKFNGYSGSTGKRSTGTVTFSKAPTDNEFSADGFFDLRGTVKNSNTDNIAYVCVSSGSYSTSYFLKGNFNTRIWLRFGSENPYIVTVYDLTSYTKNGECYGGMSYTSKNSIMWKVKNSHSMKASDATTLLPSYYCQGDDYKITNQVNALMMELPTNATVQQKLQSIHDWVIHNLYYDYASCEANSRKLQDALSVKKNGMAVCEGYANLFASMARYIGVKTSYRASNSMCHAWNQCYVGGKWKLVDATWDDPSAKGDTNKYAESENYSYFLISTTGLNNDHYDDGTDSGRSAETELPFRLDGPDGWY